MQTKNQIKIAAILYSCLLALFLGCNTSFAYSASQVERAQEVIDKEKALREKLGEENKVFIRDIIVKGVTLLSEDEVKEALLPYQGHYLTQRDIRQIIDAIKELYRDKGYNDSTFKISHQVRNRNLEIRVKELNY